MIPLKSFVYSALFMSLLSACSGPKGAVNSQESEAVGIMGGEVVTKDSAAAKLVVLVRNFSENSFCSGVLLSEDLVLTVSHCLSQDLSKIEIIFNTDFSRRKPEDIRKVLDSRQMHMQESTDASVHMARHELAVVRLQNPAPSGMSKARLAMPHEKIKVGSQFLAVGYGMTHGRLNDDHAQDDSGVLRKVTLEVDAWYRENIEFTVNQSQGAGVCVADSGSPALAWDSSGQAVVRGIASGVYYPFETEKDADDFDFCRGKSIFIDVTSHLEWLNQAISELSRSESTRSE